MGGNLVPCPEIGNKEADGRGGGGGAGGELTFQYVKF